MPELKQVDYDPFKPPARARSTKLTPVDHDPFATPDPQGAALAAVPGSRVTSTMRSPTRNRMVGGAQNSYHLKGEAVDFVPPPGVSEAQAIADIRARDPHPKELLAEGDHVHYVPSHVPRLAPVDHDPFAPPPAAPKSDPVKPVDPAALRRGVHDIAWGPSAPIAPLNRPPAAKPAPELRAPITPLPAPGSVRNGPAVDFRGQPLPSAQLREDPRIAQENARQRRPEPSSPIVRRSREALEDLEAYLHPDDPTNALPALVGAPGAVWHGLTAIPAGIAEPYIGKFNTDVIENSIGLGLSLKGPRSPKLGEIPEYTPEAVRPGPRGAELAARASAKPRLLPVDHDPFSATPQPAKGPRTRSLAAAEPPGKPLPSGIVGDEANPATRTANALYRINGGNTADKIEMQQFRDSLAPEIKAQDEDLYHALEDPLTKPGAQIPASLSAAHEALKPYLKEQTDLINDLRKRGDPTLNEYVEDQGYVHRVRADKPNLVDPEGGAPRSPFQTRKSLVRKADAQRQRKYIALETEDGQRIFPKGQDEPGNPYAEFRPGMTARGSFDQPLKVVQPTTAEIEANTATRYQKSAIDNTLSNVMQLRRVKRNVEVLDETLADMKERGVAHREEWHYPDPEGGMKLGQAKERAPAGFVSIPDVPQLKGWKFDKNDAQVQELKDWLPRVHDEDWLQKFDRVNNFMLRSNFLSPFVHPKNIAEFWATGRGGDWLSPEGYGRLGRTWGDAVSEVLSMGPKYKDYLREGSALMSGDARTAKFQEMLTNKGGEELAADPKSFEAIQQAFGKPFKSAAEMYTKYQEWSHKMMWMASDVMMMQRVLELQEKGMPVRDAIRKAEEVIPNYRVPAQIMDSPTGGRMLSHMFGNNRLFSIGRYHYNKLAAWGRMFKKLAKGTPEERKEAAGQFLVAAVLGSAVLPVIDKGLQMATGNQNAKVKRGGLLAVPDAIGSLATGKENLAQAIASVIDLSPAATMGKEILSNKDYYGNDVVDKFHSPLGNAARVGETAASEFGPTSMAMNAAKGNYGPGRVIGNLFGVELPQNAPGQMKGSTAKMLRNKARKQERNDPFISALGALR